MFFSISNTLSGTVVLLLSQDGHTELTICAISHILTTLKSSEHTLGKSATEIWPRHEKLTSGQMLPARRDPQKMGMCVM
jgi:hypothetical protein